MIDVLAPAIEVWFSILEYGPYPVYALISFSFGIMLISAFIKVLLRFGA